MVAKDRSIYLGPRLKRLRRELGLTQGDMAADLQISASYIALMERNQRPVTADLLLRLARTYRIDMSDLAAETSGDSAAQLQAVLRDPLFSGIDLPAIEVGDAALNYPGVTEALMRLYTAHQEGQLALADAIAAVEALSGDVAGGDVLARDGASGDVAAGNVATGNVAAGDAGATQAAVAARAGGDPVPEVRAFLSARGNAFPLLDDAAEVLVTEADAAGGIADYLKSRFGLRIRRLPSAVMVGSLRRYDRHRSEVVLDETLDAASQRFQLALQLCYLALRRDIDATLAQGQFSGEAGRILARRALASYAAAAIVMPYAAFSRAAEARHYDVEVLARQFNASFEQIAHRLTTLQRPGQKAADARVPFFFIRVDQAGNVSKRLDGAGFPFARHGGACPLWSLHRAFMTPRQIVTQWLELPDGQRFFSIARTVTAGGGAYGAARVERAIALGCAAEYAPRLIYAMHEHSPPEPTPIGISCRLCQRTMCAARSAPPIGREMVADDYRRTATPFGLVE